jgi:hypothetical protein
MPLHAKILSKEILPMNADTIRADPQLVFDFSQFAQAGRDNLLEKNISASRNVHRLSPPSETTILDNSPPGLYSITGKKLEINKHGHPTKRGWSMLYKYLSIYRNKRYETIRLLFVDKYGLIKDYVALCSFLPHKCFITPDSIGFKSFFSQIADQVFIKNYNLILIHNHPSGIVQESDRDMHISRVLKKMFRNRFSGHIILDHGQFNLYIPRYDKWQTVSRFIGKLDPLVSTVQKPYMNVHLTNTFLDNYSKLLKFALNADDHSQWNNHDWVPVAFTNGYGLVTSIHYYSKNEFLEPNAASLIKEKTVSIGLLSGSSWAFPFSNDKQLHIPIKNITSQVKVFRDYCVNGSTTITDKVIGGSLYDLYPSTTSCVSSFPLSLLHDNPIETILRFAASEDNSLFCNDSNTNTGVKTMYPYNDTYKKFPKKRPPAFLKEIFRPFLDHPFTPGVQVPPFALQDDKGISSYSACSFLSRNHSTVTLRNKTQETPLLIPAALYDKIIANAASVISRLQDRNNHSPNALLTKVFSLPDEKRPNSAVNFWHNFRILCREQANNPIDAMDIARSIVKQMPPAEKLKFRRQITLYQNTTRRLTSNPLLAPFIKPQETFNQRILNYYQENVRDLPIKNRSPYDASSFSPFRPGNDTLDVPGKLIAPPMKLKIGDTVKLSLNCKTVFGESYKKLPVSEFVITSSSSDFNKIVLVDKSGNSKFTLPQDVFLSKMRKIETKIEKKRRKIDKAESISL